MKKKILFLGQKKLGEKCFKYLLEINKDNILVEAVVSNKDRNNWWKTNKCYKLAQKNNIYFISNKKKNERKILEIIKKKKINCIISVQHSWIIKDNILKSVKYFAFNIHNGKLPQYKGFNSINLAILNKERFFYSTLHFMIAKVDMGDIVFEEKITIKKNDNAKTLYNKVNNVSFVLFKKLIKYLSEDIEINKKKIITSGKFYSREYIEKFREIKNINDKKEVDIKTRAFYFPPFESAYYLKNNKKQYLKPKDNL